MIVRRSPTHEQAVERRGLAPARIGLPREFDVSAGASAPFFNALPGLNMAEWIIRWGIPLGLLGGYVAAVASTGTNPTTMFYDLLESLRSGILGAVPRFL